MEPGQLISHYELIEKIGEGGMGHVYKARDTKLNRHVAIKLLPPGLTADEERRLRFRREAQAAAALDRATSLAPEYRDRVAEGNTRSRIAEASGDLPRAIAAYREMQKPTVQYAWGSPVDRTLALYELARLEDQAGDQASARQHYEDFLDRWGDADLPIPAVAEAKDRLAILTP